MEEFIVQMNCTDWYGSVWWSRNHGQFRVELFVKVRELISWPSANQLFPLPLPSRLTIPKRIFVYGWHGRVSHVLGHVYQVVLSTFFHQGYIDWCYTRLNFLISLALLVRKLAINWARTLSSFFFFSPALHQLSSSHPQDLNHHLEIVYWGLHP